MEFEHNAKSKALKAKKRLELDNTKKANNEAQKSIKQKLVDTALSCGSASLVERHCAALAMVLDEARALLKTELGGAQVTSTDTAKQLQWAERRCEELQFARDEEKKNQARMLELTAAAQK